MYEAIVGLECHVQLDTRSKLFCSCPNVDVDLAPNRAICEICIGHPGTLPTLNQQAVTLAIRAALATGCTVHHTSVFARKQYFYPDLPKGYQITQYDEPIATNGHVHTTGGTFRIHRIHIEEDAGKSVHSAQGTGVDFNRAGTPLVEIVSEADMRNADDAVAYAKMLHRVMVAAGITGGDMEKGHFRVDANVSVHRPGTPWGTRTEVKNLNSFRFLKRAVNFEIDRQISLLEAGGEVLRQTLAWRSGGTVPVRGKEAEADYRYFPEPDLLPLQLSPEQITAGTLPVPLDVHLLREDERHLAGFHQRYGLEGYVSGVLLANDEARSFFEACVAAGGDGVAMANWVQTEVLRRLGEQSLAAAELTPEALVALQRLVDEGVFAHSAAKAVFDVLWSQGGDPARIVEERGLASVSDATLIRGIVRRSIEENPEQVRKYANGNKRIIGFFMGQVMRVTRGRADPALANQIVAEELNRR